MLKADMTRFPKNSTSSETPPKKLVSVLINSSIRRFSRGGHACGLFMASGRESFERPFMKCLRIIRRSGHSIPRNPPEGEMARPSLNLKTDLAHLRVSSHTRTENDEWQILSGRIASEALGWLGG